MQLRETPLSGAWLISAAFSFRRRRSSLEIDPFRRR